MAMLLHPTLLLYLSRTSTPASGNCCLTLRTAQTLSLQLLFISRTEKKG